MKRTDVLDLGKEKEISLKRSRETFSVKGSFQVLSGRLSGNVRTA